MIAAWPVRHHAMPAPRPTARRKAVTATIRRGIEGSARNLLMAPAPQRNRSGPLPRKRRWQASRPPSALRRLKIAAQQPKAHDFHSALRRSSCARKLRCEYRRTFRVAMRLARGFLAAGFRDGRSAIRGCVREGLETPLLAGGLPRAKAPGAPGTDR